ncbi:MAG: hypothetical protein PHE36_04125 [Novosphingobium sp.]|nr:hypothetical protein [Novosphingobium sp.]
MDWKWTAALALLPLAACVTAGAPAAPPACPQTRNWQAWINAMPGPGMVPTLIVMGEADIPAGMTWRLEPGPTDRMMPPGQRFTLSLVPGDGPVGWQHVRGEIKPALSAYGSVIVGCAGKEIARVDEVKTAY